MNLTGLIVHLLITPSKLSINSGLISVAFLTKYANYGITMIKDVIDDTDDIEMLEALMTFLNSTYETGVAGIDGDNELEDFDE